MGKVIRLHCTEGKVKHCSFIFALRVVTVVTDHPTHFHLHYQRKCANNLRNYEVHIIYLNVNMSDFHIFTSNLVPLYAYMACSRAGVSYLYMGKDHTSYCWLVRGLLVEM